MKKLLLLLVVAFCLCFSGCFYSGIHGKVIDSATGKPIEGALVVAQWTKKHGFGMTYHTLSKITETLTDKEGVFNLTGIYDPFVEPPEMIIYKEGYSPWRNDLIFPSCNIVKDHEWKNNVTYKLDVLSDKYTVRQIWEFMDYGVIGLGDAPILHKIHSDISGRKVDEDEKIKLKNKLP